LVNSDVAGRSRNERSVEGTTRWVRDAWWGYRTSGAKAKYINAVGEGGIISTGQAIYARWFKDFWAGDEVGYRDKNKRWGNGDARSTVMRVLNDW